MDDWGSQVCVQKGQAAFSRIVSNTVTERRACVNRGVKIEHVELKLNIYILCMDKTEQRVGAA